MPFRLDHNVPPDSSNAAFRVDVKALCAQMVHQFAIFGATATTSFDPKVESSLPLWPLAMLTFEYISFLGTVLAQSALRESSVCVGQPGGVQILMFRITFASGVASRSPLSPTPNNSSHWIRKLLENVRADGWTILGRDRISTAADGLSCGKPRT